MATYVLPYQPHLPPIQQRQQQRQTQHQHQHQSQHHQHQHQHQHQPQQQFQQQLPHQHHHYPPQHQHQYQHQQPPVNPGSYSTSSYRPDLPHMGSSSGAGQLSSRYPSGPPYPQQGATASFASAPLLPQPGHQMLNQQHHTTNPPASQSYAASPSAPIPAPTRPDYTSLTAPTIHHQILNRPPLWTAVSPEPTALSAQPDERPNAQKVGSQGRKGLFPCDPGWRSGDSESDEALPLDITPVKNEEGRFPCPHCGKAYLHAKHLKRHWYRHTGVRPYRCVICQDTFSRSDILKRHFAKCSLRRGNPTGATHLSHPASRLKMPKNTKKAAKTEAKSKPASPVSEGHAVGVYQHGRGAGTRSSSTSNFSDPPTNGYSTAATTPGALPQSASQQILVPSNTAGGTANGSWATSEQAGRQENASLYHSGQFNMSQPSQMLPGGFSG